MIHIDVWGPYGVKTHSSCNQFITIVDDFTCFTWIHLLKYRTNVMVVMTNFFSCIIHTQFNAKVSCVWSDNAKELIEGDMKLLLLKFGIHHQTSCADTPQQNGVVEREHRHVLETTRAIFLHSKVPDIFWGDNILCSAYIFDQQASSFCSSSHFTLWKIISSYTFTGSPKDFWMSLLNLYIKSSQIQVFSQSTACHVSWLFNHSEGLQSLQHCYS